MFKLMSAVMCFICVSALHSENLDLIFHDSFDTHIANVAIAKDSTLVLNTYEKLSETELVGKVFKSTDLGQNWDMIWMKKSTEDMEQYYTYYWNYISAISKDTIVLFNSSGYISKTFDGGETWDSTNVLDSDIGQISCFKKKHNQIAYVFETEDLLIYSNDYGLTWDTYTLPTVQSDQFNPITIMLEGNNKLVVANSKSYLTEDDELTTQVVLDYFDSGNWIKENTVYNNGIAEMYKLNNGDILAMSYKRDSLVKDSSLCSYKLYDGKFELKEKWLPAILPSITYWDPSIAAYGDKILLTRQDTLWTTTNNGATWSFLEKELQQPYSGCRLNGVDILENGLGIFMDKKAAYLYNPNPTSVAEEMSSNESISIYPNPSSGVFTVSSDEPGVQDIRVYDVQGNEVEVLDELSSDHDLSHLPSGTYYLRFDYKEKVKIRKIVLSK